MFRIRIKRVKIFEKYIVFLISFVSSYVAYQIFTAWFLTALYTPNFCRRSFVKNQIENNIYQGEKIIEWYFISIVIGIAVAEYFIGDGLKNFKNPDAKGLIDSLGEDGEHELTKENDVHYFMGNVSTR